eukprot:TRINITY_DN1346_c0_g1_i1.p1 TRINITY_DN1346_c0_g1~~TRINITY_DN1346_c0_g1_i1.p1  ORF type:complete len:433 (+),score=143.99 TRINITY_DN1346_c0_g1_i1:92-1390(+)
MAVKASLALAIVGQQLVTAHAAAAAFDEAATCAAGSPEACGRGSSGEPGTEHLLMQLKRHEVKKAAQVPKKPKQPQGVPEDEDDPIVSINTLTAESCCSKCGDGQFCSKYSGNCYDSKRKDYYYTCEAASEPELGKCCSSCMKGKAAFCSPYSFNCYDTQAKDYYHSCPEGGDMEPPMPLAPSAEGSVKFMSYNLYGWNAFGTMKWRSKNVLGKIQAWGPSVLGAQEVELGDGKGYATVRDVVVDATGLAEGGGSQFFSEGALEKLESIDYMPLVGGYWLSFAKYKQKATGKTFLFFNSHWKHHVGLKQAKIIAAKVAELRQQHGELPTILVGDTNQFCRAYETKGIKYLKGEYEASPVVFVDAIAQDSGKSFSDKWNPDCRVDFILASKGDWSLVKSFIDRDGMGEFGKASDHAPLMAELVPLADSVLTED